MKLGIKVLIGVAVLAMSLVSSNAVTMVAGIAFDDSAFADKVLSSRGAYNLSGAATTLEGAVTGSSLTKYACYAYSPNVPYDPPDHDPYIQLGFTDNYLVNGPGYDLALFEFGLENTFRVSITIGEVKKTYLAEYTGFTSEVPGAQSPLRVNVARVNLDDFGVASGAQLSSVVVGMYEYGQMVSLSVAGALNSSAVPDAGSTLSLLALACLSLGAFRRKV